MNEALTGLWYDIERPRALPWGPRHFCRPGQNPTTFAIYDLDNTPTTSWAARRCRTAWIIWTAWCSVTPSFVSRTRYVEFSSFSGQNAEH